MKRLKLGLIMFGLLINISLFAQDIAKTIVIVNKADWCSICKANGQRAMEAFMNANSDNQFKLFVNDATNEETKKVANAVMTQQGYLKIMEDHTGTGIFYFFDAKTKKVIAQISVANSNDEITRIMNKLKE